MPVSASSVSALSSGSCSSLLTCVAHAWRLHPMRALSLTVLLVLAFFAASVYSLVRSILAQNEAPPLVDIELEYPDDRKLRFDTFVANASTRSTVWSLPLSTSGRHVVGADGRPVRLASVNWYGASDAAQVPGGLEAQHRALIASAIHRLGFNSVRLPYSDEMVRTNPVVDAEQVAANPDLVGLRVLDVFFAVVHALTEQGIAVIVNNHITESRWCCDLQPCDLTWSNSALGPLCRVRQTEDDWIANWRAVMAPLVDNPLVIGADLRNEPRGLFGAPGWAVWARAAAKCGDALHKLNPDWLVVVEGIGSANLLQYARQTPVLLSRANKLVYSAHVYGWSGWGSGRPYWTRGYGSFAAEMRANWGWLMDEDVAPVWVGEFGAPAHPNKGDAHYWHNLMRYLREVGRPGFAYWALNPTKFDGQGEGYSVVQRDWLTPRRDYRLFDILRLIEGDEGDGQGDELLH